MNSGNFRKVVTLSKHAIATALRGGTLSATLVAGVLFAPSAIADGSTETEIDNDSSVVSVGDVGSGNAVDACHNSVNALGVQAANIADGIAANVPILNDEPVSAAEGGANCNASATTVENDDSDNGGGNGDGDHDNGHNGGDDGHDNGDNGNGHNGGGNGDNGHNGGGAGNGGNGDADEHADANGNAPQPVPAEDHISVTG